MPFRHALCACHPLTAAVSLCRFATSPSHCEGVYPNKRGGLWNGQDRSLRVVGAIHESPAVSAPPRGGISGGSKILRIRAPCGGSKPPPYHGNSISCVGGDDSAPRCRGRRLGDPYPLPLRGRWLLPQAKDGGRETEKSLPQSNATHLTAPSRRGRKRRADSSPNAAE